MPSISYVDSKVLLYMSVIYDSMIYSRYLLILKISCTVPVYTPDYEAPNYWHEHMYQSHCSSNLIWCANSTAQTCFISISYPTRNLFCPCKKWGGQTWLFSWLDKQVWPLFQGVSVSLTTSTVLSNGRLCCVSFNAQCTVFSVRQWHHDWWRLTSEGRSSSGAFNHAQVANDEFCHILIR